MSRAVENMDEYLIKVILISTHNTLKCLSIGTPKTIDFPFVPNGKLMVLGVPIFEHIRLFCAQILHLDQMKILLFFSVPILKHFTVYYFQDKKENHPILSQNCSYRNFS